MGNSLKQHFMSNTQSPVTIQTLKNDLSFFSHADIQKRTAQYQEEINNYDAREAEKKYNSNKGEIIQKLSSKLVTDPDRNCIEHHCWNLSAQDKDRLRNEFRASGWFTNIDGSVLKVCRWPENMKQLVVMANNP